jgi:hypothetical protein
MPSEVNRKIQGDRDTFARRTICEEFGKMGAQGYGQFRARWLPREGRIQFQGERENRWEPGAELTGQVAQLVASALAGIQNKRNAQVEVSARRKPDYEDFAVRVAPDSLAAHRADLPRFLEGQLFWD